LILKKIDYGIAGYNVEGFKEIKYINDIVINISDEYLTVKFVTDEQINKKALEDYYFTIKVFKAIYKFAYKINLKPLILFNDNEWKVESFEGKL
jgi:hypothetical protein